MILTAKYCDNIVVLQVTLSKQTKLTDSLRVIIQRTWEFVATRCLGGGSGCKSMFVLGCPSQWTHLTLCFVFPSVINMPEGLPAPGDQFTRTGEYQCSVSDSQKKSLVLVQDSRELHAVTLQGGSSHRKVHLNMSTYVHPSPNTEARPVALGIKGTNLYLSCHQDGDTPTLHLESLEDGSSLTRIDSESESVRFLFYKRDSGVSNSTLMSARFPNWFISTAEEDNLPVEMCQRTANRYINFNIQRQS
ncbi:interleukin-1 beta isoform X1 [Dunckerocampus dactyliophorus]|uniref:interleukin-1 beta isoform X1 n=1 Tax=Dunckerocampus dactyliophorus TaxID=161453 RepID=UPI002405824F|nr:interleukin-1 beta isoform X1 [Dunckerocampus dactyliophorus]